MKITVSNADNLPEFIPVEGLREVLTVLAGHIGVHGTVRVVVSLRGKRTLAHVKRATITVYPRGFASDACKRDPRFDVLRLWAWTLAHEMVHVRQNQTEADTTRSIYEAEAEALEPVFGPIAENVLREWTTRTTRLRH